MPRLLDRVIERRRQRGAGRTDASPEAETEVSSQRIAALEKRIERLESQLEAFQDSVYREAVRRQREIESLEQKTEADEIARALDRHSREHRL